MIFKVHTAHFSYKKLKYFQKKKKSNFFYFFLFFFLVRNDQIWLKMRIFAHYERLAQHNRDILLKV